MSVCIHKARDDEPARQSLGAARRFSRKAASVVYPKIDRPVAVRQLNGAHRP
jgi:hypothetical protein